MAITISVDSAIVSAEATSIISNSITALLGDTQLFIMVTVDDTTEGDITTIVDSEAETITQLADFTNGNRLVRLFSIASPNLNARTITVNFGAATDCYLDLFTVQGSVTDADPSDVTATSNANDTAPDTAITPTASAGMIIWLVHQSNNSAYTVLGSGQSERGQAVVGGAEKSSVLFTTEIFIAAPGNQTATASKSGNWIGLAVEIKEAVGAAIVKIADEVLEHADSGLSILGFTQIGSDVLEHVDSAIKVLGIVQIGSDILDHVESAISKVELRRIANEVLEHVEGAIPVLALVRIGSDILEHVETAISKVEIRKIADEILDHVESAIALVSILKIANEILDHIENSLAIIGIVKIANEILDHVESALRFLALVRIGSDILDHIETALNLRGIVKIANEILDHIETAIKVIVQKGIGIFGRRSLDKIRSMDKG